MNFVYFIDNPIINVILSFGEYIYNFFAFLGELSNTPILNGSITNDILIQTFYNPFVEDFVTIDLVHFDVAGTHVDLTNFNDNIVNAFNYLIRLFDRDFHYLFEVILYSLIPLTIGFFVLLVVKEIIRILVIKP